MFVALIAIFIYFFFSNRLPLLESILLLDELRELFSLWESLDWERRFLI
jgi:hypothetical protein